MLTVLSHRCLFSQWNEGGGEARRLQGDADLNGDAPMTENDLYSSLNPGEVEHLDFFSLFFSFTIPCLVHITSFEAFK